MYKAVFIDIDGTLIKSDHSISQVTIDTIKKVKEKGIHVVLVSARPLHGIINISKQIGLDDVPIASLNGSYIALKDEILYNCTIDPLILEDLYSSLKKYKVSIIYYQQMKWYAEVENKYTINEQKITGIPIIIKPFNELPGTWNENAAGPNKLLVIGEDLEITKIQKEIKPQYQDALNMYTSKPIYLEVMDHAASKASAVKFFMERFNIAREETIAIGDNFNDIEMIEFAGLGIAMGNAPAEVKAVADFVTVSNNEDGVAKVLEKYII